jgi:hypothetical protein
MGRSVLKKHINYSTIDGSSFSSFRREDSADRLKARVRNLAEAVILQSLEDLWDPEYRGGSRDFFKGNGFRICADIAGLDSHKKIRFLHFIGGRRYGNIRSRFKEK